MAERGILWLTPEEAKKQYGIHSGSLKSYRVHGCLAGRDGRIDHKPDPDRPGKYLYHRIDLKLIAATLRINKNGRLKDADGDWLLQSAAIKLTGYGRSTLSRWRKYKCRPIDRVLGHKQVVVFEYGDRIRRVWLYYYLDLKALAKARSSAKLKPWLTYGEVRDTDPRITAQMLSWWRRRGCAALKGCKLHSKPDPHSGVALLYLRRHIDRIAKVPSLVNGRFTNSRGTWLGIAAVAEEYGLADGLADWRKKTCHLLGRKIGFIHQVVFLEDRLREVWLYSESDLDKIAKIRGNGYAMDSQADWLSVSEALQALGLTCVALRRWTKHAHPALGKNLQPRKAARTYVISPNKTRTRRVLVYRRADLEAIVRWQRDEQVKPDWLQVSQVRAEFGFNKHKVLIWRKSCRPLGGRPIGHQKSIRHTNCGRSGQWRDAWEYSREDLVKIDTFYKSDPDCYTDDKGVVHVTSKRSETNYNIQKRHEVFRNPKLRWQALGGREIDSLVVHLPVKGRRAKATRVYVENDVRDVATWLNKHDTTIALFDRTMQWGRRRFAFTTGQAACVEVMIVAFKNGRASLPDAAILERAGLGSNRLIDIFRERRQGKKVYHPAWGTLIVQGDAPGAHRLTAV